MSIFLFINIFPSIELTGVMLSQFEVNKQNNLVSNLRNEYKTLDMKNKKNDYENKERNTKYILKGVLAFGVIKLGHYLYSNKKLIGDKGFLDFLKSRFVVLKDNINAEALLKIDEWAIFPAAIGSLRYLSNHFASEKDFYGVVDNSMKSLIETIEKLLLYKQQVEEKAKLDLHNKLNDCKEIMEAQKGQTRLFEQKVIQFENQCSVLKYKYSILETTNKELMQKNTTFGEEIEKLRKLNTNDQDKIKKAFSDYNTLKEKTTAEVKYFCEVINLACRLNASVNEENREEFKLIKLEANKLKGPLNSLDDFELKKELNLFFNIIEKTVILLVKEDELKEKNKGQNECAFDQHVSVDLNKKEEMNLQKSFGSLSDKESQLSEQLFPLEVNNQIVPYQNGRLEVENKEPLVLTFADDLNNEDGLDPKDFVNNFLE